MLLAVLALAGCKDTPTETEPPPGAVIQLVAGTTVGKPTFPHGDTPQGGQGEPVSGIRCENPLNPAYHVHPHLSLFVNGEQLAIPAGIGSPGSTQLGSSAAGGRCLYGIHTHDATGILHVEPPTSSTRFNLGQAFDVWGRPLGRDNVAGYTGTVTAYVNGQRYDGELRSIRLDAGTQINLQVGSPTVSPPIYKLPPNY